MMEYWKNGMMISKSVKKSYILSPLNPLFHYSNIPVSQTWGEAELISNE
jgi:hypothetical protein